jgi:serine/threonine protein kinase
VRVLEVFEDHQQLSIVLEFIEGKNLFHWIKQEKLVDEVKSKRLFKEIVKIVAFLHSKGIVHRDIKLENIMLKDQPPSAAPKTNTKKL